MKFGKPNNVVKWYTYFSMINIPYEFYLIVSVLVENINIPYEFYHIISVVAEVFTIRFLRVYSFNVQIESSLLY